MNTNFDIMISHPKVVSVIATGTVQNFNFGKLINTPEIATVDQDSKYFPSRAIMRLEGNTIILFKSGHYKIQSKSIKGIRHAYEQLDALLNDMHDQTNPNMMEGLL